MTDTEQHPEAAVDGGERGKRPSAGFYRQLQAIFRHHIPENSRVLEWGCGTGNLLRTLRPSRGLGIDVDSAIVGKPGCRSGEQALEFRTGDLHEEIVGEKFDYIVLSYLTEHLRDVQQCFQNLLHSATRHTRLHIATLNSPWFFPITLAQNMGFVSRRPANWLSRQDLVNLLELSGWEVIRSESEQLFPFDIPGLSFLCNRIFVRLPFLRHYGITLHLVARPRCPVTFSAPITCSVVLPARNEAGNIRAALDRIPILGNRTEVLFVEGNSTDDTWEAIQREIADYAGPHLVRALQQSGKGKWDAVKAGFSAAEGEVLVIQDADLTAPPEDLAKFYEALANGVAEMANGSRLVYPMEAKAMRFLNLLGNHFFAGTLSSVLGQPIKDSLCGTKMMFRQDYQRAMKRIEEFGDFDPFGDFSLLFGAALLSLRIRDVPVRYEERKYGRTNIARFRHGLVLMKMAMFGLRRIRFFPIRTGEVRSQK